MVSNIKQCYVSDSVALSLFGIVSLPFVFDVGDVSVVVRPVGDDLGAAIGQGNAVGSCNHSSIRTLVMIEVAGTFAIGDGITENVRHRRLRNGNICIKLGIA